MDDTELLRVGDVILGVTGVCVLGMGPAMLDQAIDAARLATPGGLVVLHVSDMSVDASLVDEVTLQMASAAAELIGSREVIERVQSAVYGKLVLQPLPNVVGAEGSC